MDIAERIRLIRKSKNLTQEQAAEKAGLKRANYARMESRGNSLSLEQLQQIADGLGVAVAEIMGDETSRFSAKSLSGVAEGEEFERLKARVRELEGMVSDKQKIIEAYEEKLSEVSDEVFYFVYEFFIVSAEQLGYWRVEKVPSPENEIVPGVKVYYQVMSEKEMLEVARLMLDKFELVRHILETNIIQRKGEALCWYEALDELEREEKAGRLGKGLDDIKSLKKAIDEARENANVPPTTPAPPAR